MDSSSENNPFHQNEQKDYDDFLNLFDSEPIEKTLQKGSDVIFYTAAPVTNSGKKFIFKYTYYSIDFIINKTIFRSI